MNKKNFILTALCCLTFMIIGGVVGYFIADSGSLTNADDYIKSTILPVILGSGAGGSIFALAMTLILNSLKVATTKFGASSDKFDKAFALISEQNEKLIKSNEDAQKLAEQISAMQTEITTLKKMVATGLCNTQELVKSGVATEIAKISEHIEEDKEVVKNENKD